MKSDRYSKQLWWLLQELETAVRASHDGIVHYSVRTGYTDPSPETQHDLLIALFKDGVVSFLGNEYEVRHPRPQKVYELRVNSMRFRQVYDLASIHDENADVGEVGEVFVVNASQYAHSRPRITYTDNYLTIGSAVIKIRPDSKQDMLCAALFNSKKTRWDGVELYAKLDELYDENSADTDPVQLKRMWRRLQKATNDLNQKIEKASGVKELLRAEAKQIHLDIAKLNT